MSHPNALSDPNHMNHIMTMDEGFEELKAVPGIDPVLAVLDGHPKDIPQDGWYIGADLTPGASGVIKIVRYEAGGVEVSEESDRRKTSAGEATIVMCFFGHLYRHVVAYEDPASRNNVEPYRRGRTGYTGLGFDGTDLVDLPSGGRLLDQKEELVRHGGRLGIEARYQAIDGRPEHRSIAMISRVTGSRAGLREILLQLGRAMGMSRADLETLVTTLEPKLPGDGALASIAAPLD